MKKTKKILLVTEYYPPVIYGGGEIGAQMLAQGLHNNGHEVAVLTSRAPGKASEENEHGVKVLRVLKTGNPRTILGNIVRRLFFSASAKKNIKKLDAVEHFDAIHFLNNTSVIDLGEKNEKTVATINSYNALCPKANLFYKEKKPCTGCSPGKYVGCITCSNYVGRVLLPWFLKYNPLFWLWNYASYLRQREQLRRVGKKIVFNQYAAALMKRLGIKQVHVLPNLGGNANVPQPTTHNPQPILTLAYIGGLEKMKGIAEILKAYALLKQKNENVRIIFVGSGRYELVLLPLSRYDSNIVLKGLLSHSEVQKLYAEIDAVLIPSLWPEPFSRVLLEAYHHGVPVIATAVGGNADYVADGVTGYLVNPERAAEEIASAITKLKNKRHCAQLGKQARAYYEKNLAPEETLKKIEALYDAHDSLADEQ